MQLTPLTLGEHAEATGRSRETTAASAPNVIGRIDATRISHLRGAALNQMVRNIASSDPNYPVNADEHTFNLYMRRLRRIAYQSVLEREHADQRETITAQEISQRIVLSATAEFARVVLETARQSMQMRDAGDDLDEAADQPDFDHDFEEVDEDDEPNERDAEDAHGNSDRVVVRATGGEMFEGSGTEEVPYSYIAKSFMSILLDNTMSSKVPWVDRSDEERRCRLCVMDDTIPDKMKTKVWDAKDHLENHMATNKAHSQYAVWKRRQTILHDEHQKKLEDRAQELRAEADDEVVPELQEELRSNANGQQQLAKRWFCPYCPEHAANYFGLNYMVRHVTVSTPEKFGEEHDKLKEADGWYTGDDFFGEKSTKSAKTAVRRQKQRLHDIGFEFKHEPLLHFPEPVEGKEGVFRGMFRELGHIPPRFAGIIHRGNDPANSIGQPLPAHFEMSIRRGDSESAAQREVGFIPDHLQGIVTRGDQRKSPASDEA